MEIKELSNNTWRVSYQVTRDGRGWHCTCPWGAIKTKTGNYKVCRHIKEILKYIGETKK